MAEASTRKLQTMTMTDAFIRKIMETDPNSTTYSLDVHNKQIRHLSNLESVPKLRSLDVSFNRLQDLEVSGVNGKRCLR